MPQTALIIIDVQKGMFTHDDPVFKGEELVSEISSFAGKSRNAGIPVVIVQHSGSKGDSLEPDTEGWQLRDEILSESSEPVVHKNTPDSFLDTDLDLILKSMDVNRLVICGIQTELCVDTTCRSAFSHGYRVVLLSDCHSTWSRGDISPQQLISNTNSIISDWFGEVMTASEAEEKILSKVE